MQNELKKILLTCMIALSTGSCQASDKYEDKKGDLNKIILQIKNDEGFSPYPYGDNGRVAIGYGSVIDEISEEEASLILIYRIIKLQLKLNKLNWYKELDTTRKEVITNMGYNLGFGGLLLFKKMIKHLENHDYNKASLEMKRSLWYNQVGERANRLIVLMEFGDEYDKE